MWCVLQVRTGEEINVRNSLKRMELTAYVPRENRLQRKSGVWTSKEYTLFPSYVFIELEYTAENYYRIKDIPAVLSFLGDGFMPGKLTTIEVEWIKLLSCGGEPIEPSRIRLSEDGSIEILGGMLKSFGSKIIRIDKRHKKATFEITICGEKRSLELSAEIENSV